VDTWGQAVLDGEPGGATGDRLLVDQIDRLHSVFRQVRERHPLTGDALVVFADRIGWVSLA